MSKTNALEKTWKLLGGTGAPGGTTPEPPEEILREIAKRQAELSDAMNRASNLSAQDQGGQMAPRATYGTIGGGYQWQGQSVGVGNATIPWTGTSIGTPPTTTYTFPDRDWNTYGTTSRQYKKPDYPETTLGNHVPRDTWKRFQFDWNGWTLIWTGWKQETASATLYGQWIGKSPRGDTWVAATPGDCRKYLPFSQFDVSVRDGQASCTEASTEQELTEACREALLVLYGEAIKPTLAHDGSKKRTDRKREAVRDWRKRALDALSAREEKQQGGQTVKTMPKGAPQQNPLVNAWGGFGGLSTSAALQHYGRLANPVRKTP